MTRALIFAVSITCAVVISTTTAFGQVRQVRPNRLNQRYQPATPTFSPYMDYFRRDVGLLDPYNYFVQRNSRLRATLDQQQYQLDRQGLSLDAVGYEVLQAQASYLNRFAPVRAAPTGKAASFQTHLPYYRTR